jgi:hypothetical protein
MDMPPPDDAPDRTFTQAELDAIVARRLAKAERAWRTEAADMVRRAVELALEKLKGTTTP